MKWLEMCLSLQYHSAIYWWKIEASLKVDRVGKARQKRNASRKCIYLYWSEL